MLEDDGALDAVALSASEPVLVVSSIPTPSAVEDLGFTKIIIRDTPAAAMAVAPDNTRWSMTQTAYAASAHFAWASHLALQGAQIVEADVAAIVLPGLGEVACDATPVGLLDEWRALDIYETIPPAIGAEASWPLPAFVYPARRGEHVETGEPRIDLTGRSRTLLFGPYTYLSAGHWLIEAEVMIDPEDGAAHIRFEWGANPQFTTISARVAEAGVYNVRMHWSCDIPAAAELRVIATQAHFEGTFELLSVTVRRVAEDSATAAGVR